MPGYLKQADIIMDLDLDIDRAQPAHASPKRWQSFHDPALFPSHLIGVAVPQVPKSQKSIFIQLTVTIYKFLSSI